MIVTNNRYFLEPTKQSEPSLGSIGLLRETGKHILISFLVKVESIINVFTRIKPLQDIVAVTCIIYELIHFLLSHVA